MRNFWNLITWILVGAAALLAVVLPLVTSGRAAILPVLLLAVPIALIDGIRRYGWKLMGGRLIELLARNP